MRGSNRTLAPVFAALLLAAAPTWSCVNTFESDIQDSLAMGDAAAVEAIVQRLEKAHAGKPTLETGNDLGVARLLTGKIDEAITLFRATEKKFPGNARVAANLGTALELKGENEEARRWIREGVLRDPSEHEGSEWLHVRILDAKLALAKDSGWFARNSVLSLDFGSGDVPVAPEILPIEKGKLKGAEDLLRQINYQLDERTKFVKAPDPIVGDLYASAGDLSIASGLSLLGDGNSEANRFYASALAYGAPHADLIRKRLARYEASLAALPPKPKVEEAVVDYPAPAPFSETRLTVWTSVAAAIGLGLAGFVAFRIWRKRKDAQS